MADVTFSVAESSDDAELRAFLRAHPTPGNVSLRFEREPNYFAGENVAGSRDTTIVARRDGRLVCMGRCSRRELYLDDQRCDIGYLGELRLAPDTPRGLAVLREGYAFFAALESADPAALYFTSVAQTNTRARAVLESGRLGLPRYEPLAELVTLACPVRRTSRWATAAKCASEAELTDFLEINARAHSLAMPWSPETWRTLKPHGLHLEDFVVIRSHGRIVAAGALWDQSAWRQTIVHDYTGALRALRPLLNPLFALGGWSRLPAPGECLRQACVHPLAVAPDAPDAALELLLALEQRAASRGIEWLVVAAEKNEPILTRISRRLGVRSYATQLYAVHLNATEPRTRFQNARTFRPEVGLL